MGKTHALPFTPSLTSYTAHLQLIVSDLWGPASTSSNNSFKYYISFVDMFSCYTRIYFLQSKSDAFSVFLQFKTMVEKFLGRSILRFQSDGGEFKSFTPFLQRTSIDHRIICPYTSQQNGVVERKHRHIVDMGLSLLSQSSISLSFCDDAFSTAVFLSNRILGEFRSIIVESKI